jgi:undecaprenyl-diphosphatase
MPTSSSFPSGHSATAFGFVAAVAPDYPVLSVPLFGLAGVVGYSRVHTGVHFPADVLGGAALGCAIGALTRAVAIQIGPRCLRQIG